MLSVALSRSKWQLIDIIAMNYIIYTHNFTLMESQKSPLFNHMLPVKILPAISKPWQVQREINNKIGFLCLPNFCRLHVVELDITLKPLNKFYMLHTIVKRRLLSLGFILMYKNPKQNNIFTTHYSGIEGNFTCIDC